MASTGGETKRFSGKVALVTGAASGIGRAIVLRLAEEGAEVFGHDIDGDGLEETAKLVGDAGGSMRRRQGDCSSRAECRGTVEECVGAYGRLDVLGNVAGIGHGEHFTDVSEEQYRRMMGVNVDGYFFTAQAALPHLLDSGGNIVNIASCAGLIGQAYTVVYCMTKGAVVQLTRALAMEYAKTPLRVNAIARPASKPTCMPTFRCRPTSTSSRRPVRRLPWPGQPDDIAALCSPFSPPTRPATSTAPSSRATRGSQLVEPGVRGERAAAHRRRCRRDQSCSTGRLQDRALSRISGRGLTGLSTPGRIRAREPAGHADARSRSAVGASRLLRASHRASKPTR